jgi:hypothetical protein
MAVHYMSQVEQGWPTCIARIQDFKQCLKEPVQIDRWSGNPSKYQLVITRIPPAMRTAFWEARRTTWSDGHGLSVEDGGQSTRKYLPVLVLKGMDMKWRTLLARRKGARQMQFFDASVVAATVENEALTVVAQLKDKASLTC